MQKEIFFYYVFLTEIYEEDIYRMRQINPAHINLELFNNTGCRESRRVQLKVLRWKNQDFMFKIEDSHVGSFNFFFSSRRFALQMV